MDLQNLKDKARYLALAPVAALSVPAAIAGPMEAAVNTAKTEVSSSQTDLVAMLGAMLALSVVIYVGARIIGLVRR